MGDMIMYDNWLAIQRILEINMLNRHSISLQTDNKYCSLLSCRIEGESLFFHKNKSIKVCRGDILYIPSGASYSQSTENEKVIYIHMDISGNSHDDINVYHVMNSEEGDEICNSFLNISKLWSEKQHNYYYHVLSEIYRLIAEKDAVPAASHPDMSKQLINAIKYIERYYTELDFNFEDVCKASFISRTYFNKIFKNHFKITPHQYVNNLRMQKAKRLLKGGFYTRSEIARLCGFRDVKYFYAFFKSQTGMTTAGYLSSCSENG